MVGGERPRQRAAVERLEHRRLDLEEAALVEEAADRRDQPAAQDEQLAGLLVGEQVELAVPVARLDVGEPVVLVGRRPQRLREQLPRVDAQRQLAAAGAERRALDADQVAEVEVDQRLVGVAEHVLARVELDPAGAVDEVEERGLAVAAPRAQPPGEPHGVIGLLAGLERRRSARARRRSRVRSRKVVRERIDAGRAQLVELAPPLGEQALLVAAAVGAAASLGRPSSARSVYRADRPASPAGRGYGSVRFDLRDLELARRAARNRDASRRRRACGRAGRCRPATRSRACSRPGRPRPSRRSGTATDWPDFWSLTRTLRADRDDVRPRSASRRSRSRLRSLSSSWAIRASSIACSFLAWSYSAFSLMSPNSRASLMRSATSRR